MGTSPVWEISGLSHLTSSALLGGGRGERVRLALGGMRMGMLGSEPCDSVERGGSAETPKMGEAHTF